MDTADAVSTSGRPTESPGGQGSDPFFPTTVIVSQDGRLTSTRRPWHVVTTGDTLGSATTHTASRMRKPLAFMNCSSGAMSASATVPFRGDSTCLTNARTSLSQHGTATRTRAYGLVSMKSVAVRPSKMPRIDPGRPCGR